MNPSIKVSLLLILSIVLGAHSVTADSTLAGMAYGAGMGMCTYLVGKTLTTTDRRNNR